MRWAIAALVIAVLSALASAADDIPIEYVDTSNRLAFRGALAEAPASTRNSGWKFSSFASSEALSSNGRRLAGADRYSVKPIRVNSGYVRPVSGPGHSSTKRLSAAKVSSLAGKFVGGDGKVIYPGGTSWFDILQLEKFSEWQLTNILQQHYQHGVRVIRTFGHNDGWGTSMPVKKPIQPSVGKFDEAALRRYDYVLDALAKAGIRITLTMTNHWPEYGGFGWYTKEVLGSNAAPELFYSNGRVIGAFQAWLRTIAGRRNTVNGRLYAEDPTIFSWQLCNECHTSDNYEANNGIQPGSLLYNWLVKQSAFLKHDIGVKQMVSIGSEGWRARGKYDPTASVKGPFLNWMNSGMKGEDFVRNLGIKNLDFATIHVYPSNWQIPAKQYKWVNDNYIGDRASLTAANGKPLMFEEYGMPRGYMPSRNTLFNSELAAANKYGAAALLTWEVWTLNGDDWNYDYGYHQDGGDSTKTMLARQVARTAAIQSKPTPAPTPKTPVLSLSCLSKCGSQPALPAKPTKPTAPKVPVKPVYHKRFYKRSSTRAKYRLAKQAYLQNMRVYGIRLAAYKGAKKQYSALAAAYQKASNTRARFSACSSRCSAARFAVASTEVATPTPTPVAAISRADSRDVTPIPV